MAKKKSKNIDNNIENNSIDTNNESTDNIVEAETIDTVNTIRPKYSVQPTTIAELRQACIDNEGNLGVIDVTKFTHFSNLFDADPFRDWSNSSFNGIEYWDTSNVTSLYYTFGRCKYFNQPIGRWNVSNVTEFTGTFRQCSNFSQNLNNWDVSKGTSFGQMFYLAYWFSGGISKWNVSKATDFGTMFQGATRFNDNLNDWDVSNVRNMSSMFQDTRFNQPLDKWNTKSLTNMNSMFNNNSSFNQPLNNWNVSNVKYMNSTFYGCRNFNQPLDKWDVSNVENITYIFNGSKFDQDISMWKMKQNIQGRGPGTIANSPMKFEYVPEGFKFTPRSVSELKTNLSDAYKNLKWIITKYLTSLNGAFSDHTWWTEDYYNGIETWDTSNVTDMSRVFENTRYFNRDISMWDISKVTDMRYMFRNAAAFNQPLNWWITKNKNTSYMYDNCPIEEINKTAVYYPNNKTELINYIKQNRGTLYKINPYAVKDYSNLFSEAGCSDWADEDFTGVDRWFTRDVENLQNTFKDCVNFNKNLNYWPFTKVTNMDGTFQNCSNFNQPLDKWNVSTVESMNYTFNGAKVFDQDISMWDVRKVESIKDIFVDCPIIEEHKPKFKIPNSYAELRQLCIENKGNLADIHLTNLTSLENLFNTDPFISWTNEDFNGIGNWNLNTIIDISYMFKNCTNFNQDISNWNVSNVVKMVETFDNCSSFKQDLDKWNVYSITDKSNMQNAFNNSLTIPIWYPTIALDNLFVFKNNKLELNKYFTDDRDYNTINLECTNAADRVVIRNNNNGIFEVVTKDESLGNIQLRLYNENGYNSFSVNFVIPILDRTIDVDYNKIYKLDFNDIDPAFQVQLSSNDKDLTVYPIGNNVFDVTSKYYKKYTLEFNIEGATTKYNLYINTNKIFKKDSYPFTLVNCTNKTADIREIFELELGVNYDGIEFVNAYDTLFISKVSDYSYKFLSHGIKEYDVTVNLAGDTTKLHINVDKLNIAEKSFNCITFIDKLYNYFEGLDSNIDKTVFNFTCLDDTITITESEDYKITVNTTMVQEYIINVTIPDETFIIKLNSIKVLQDMELDISNNIKVTIDFNKLYEGINIPELYLTCDNPEFNIIEEKKNVYIIEADNIGDFVCTVAVNNQSSAYTFHCSKTIKDELIEVGYNEFTINFRNKYPDINFNKLNVTTSERKVIIEKKSDELYRFLFMEKGYCKINVKLGNVTSIITFKVFFLSYSNPEVYNYRDSFVNGILKEILYDPNRYIYQYNQYGEIEPISKFFDYINKRMQKYLTYTYLWYVLKTNQEINYKDIIDVTDTQMTFYINYLYETFEGIYKSFGSISTVVSWDDVDKWNQKDVKWDSILGVSNLSVNKFKAMIRYIKDIKQKSFNIIRFIQFCNEFVNADVSDKTQYVDVFVDDTSFGLLSEVTIYVSNSNEDTDMLSTIINSAYKAIMPMYNFIIRKKVKAKSIKRRKVGS